jgi:hypothetical protein
MEKKKRKIITLSFPSEYDLSDVNDFYLKFLCKVTIWIIPQSILYILRTYSLSLKS